MFYSWITLGGDVSHGRLTSKGFEIAPTKFHFLQIAAPIFLLILTRLRMPVSTTFILLTSFAATPAAVGGVLVPPQHPASAILQSKYRFAYRIRIENLSENNVQLLGRYWRIQEHDASEMEEEPVIVDAPITGAVGQLPVLQPGQVFEYMSGADLATTRGEMRGHFYMAKVSDDAKSANSGDDVQSISDEDKFEAIVAPFPLLAQD